MYDCNIHLWLQIPEGNGHRRRTHLDLMAKHSRYTKGCSPQPDRKEGD